MKIDSIEVIDYHPIKHLLLNELGDTVIIAGANGSGKTRLKQAIVSTLQGSPKIKMKILATRDQELESFQGSSVEVDKDSVNPLLREYIKNRKYGKGRFIGSLVQIDSSRNIESISYNSVDWLGGDPDDNESPISFYFTPFRNRWQDFITYIFQKSASRDKKIADELKRRPRDGEIILEENPDPLEKYQIIFQELLPGKMLLDIDPAKPGEFQYKDSTGEILNFSSLSSGEQEVVKVIFDVLRKDIKHSVIIVDEPELHLHPTLAFKLVETLKSIGDHTNQYIFLTHSADLISTYYSTGDVYFIDAIQTGANQAHKLSELNHSHSEVVKLIGENLGLFAVGKKLVFIEGQESSTDRLTYHIVAQKVLPEAKVIPVGSVSNVIGLHAVEEQIRNSIFGIELYMIRDRDGLSDSQVNQIEQNGRIKCLKRRHIENYFLDPGVLYKVAQKLYITEVIDGLTADKIALEIRRFVEDSVNYNLLQNAKDYLSLNHNFRVPTVKEISSKSIEAVKEELTQGVDLSLQELNNAIGTTQFVEWLNHEERRLNELLESDDWLIGFNGKIIFNKVCSDVLKEDKLKVRSAYIDIAISEHPEVIADIISIMGSFK